MARFGLLALATAAQALSLPGNLGFGLDQLNLELGIHGLQKALSTFDNPSCPVDIPPSCTNSTPIENSCCFELPGGVFLQTQFWDYYPPIGPEDMFTLHGLWPDNCDGSYEQFCDDGLNVKNVTLIIVDEFNDVELYTKMQRIWKNFNGNDADLWMHEFNKHGTCIKTMWPSCYNKFKTNENVYNFFQIAVRLFEQYPTYKFLEEAGIVPSTEQTYTKKQISDALEAKFGHPVYFKCNRFHAIQEIWYFHNLKGSILDGDFQKIPSFMNLQCPEEGIKFMPKKGFTPPPNQPPKPGLPTRNNIHLSGKLGCLISNGQWYGYGTCASFLLQKLTFGGYNLKSLKGFCGLNDEKQLVCNRAILPAKFQFQYDLDTKEIGYGGQFEWCYDYENRHGSGKFIQVPVKLAKNCDDPVRLKFN